MTVEAKGADLKMRSYFRVDAFTDRPFAGNPAAVVLLDVAVPETWMQKVAFELNLSETAFLHPQDDGLWNLRWMTPKVEVPLCGHATLASAHVLFEIGAVSESVRFQTLSGELAVKREAEGYAMDFPALFPRPWKPPASALAILRAEKPISAEIAYVRPDKAYAVLELPDADAVRAVSPDLRALAGELAGGWIVTARADARARQEFGASLDVVSRYFAPAVGVDEDPVTGSAHSVLSPFWRPRLGRESLIAAQISRRGGVVSCRLRGDRVELSGQAVTVARGELLVRGG